MRVRKQNEQLERSWNENAEAWTKVVRERAIESRRLATDAAIIDAVMAHAPTRVLDVGCGEGWLARSLLARAVDVAGFDGSAALVEAARAAGSGEIHHLTYDEFAARPGPGLFDVVVCNFALLHEDIGGLLRACSASLEEKGVVIIQTAHPWAVGGTYENGWRVETFAGFGPDFREPMPWFFRTLESWVNVIREAGMRVERLREPLHPEGGQPLSLLIEASRC